MTSPVLRIRSKISESVKEQPYGCDEPPARGRMWVAPLEKGLSLSDWGLGRRDFVEIFNDSSKNSLVLSNINSSNCR